MPTIQEKSEELNNAIAACRLPVKNEPIVIMRIEGEAKPDTYRAFDLDGNLVLLEGGCAFAEEIAAGRSPHVEVLAPSNSDDEPVPEPHPPYLIDEATFERNNESAHRQVEYWKIPIRPTYRTLRSALFGRLHFAQTREFSGSKWTRR